MELRKLQEKEFHDKLRTVTDDPHVSDTRWSPEIEDTIKNNPLWANMKYYAVERKSRQLILDWFKANCRGKKVLDYCCGNGDDSIQIARAGATEVLGIDLSEVSVANCTRLAQNEGVGDICRFEVADAEDTKLPDNSFDIISEYGSLHHVDLKKSYAELARLVRPEGKVICNETLGHNPAIHLYRKLTPKLRTPWEVDHILKKPQLELAKDYFGNVEMHFFHLATLLAVPFRKTALFNPMLSVLEAIDSAILKLPFIKWQAWQVVYIMSEPKKG